MCQSYLVILSCFYFLFQLTAAASNTGTKLLFVQILLRHGDRAPIQLYPTDPNPPSVWPEGIAHLTKLGMRQQYSMGKYLHTMYENFSTFNPFEIKVVSSEVDRCLKSAATNLASFFAPTSQWAFDSSFNWQPISIKYNPKESDRYLETDSYCPRAKAEQERLVQSPEGQAFLKEHELMFRNLTFYSGNPIVNWTQASYLHDVLFIEKKYNLTVPSWSEPFWEELKNVSNLSFFWSFNSPLLHRLRAGPLLGSIIDNMKRKIQGDIPNQKFQIYSGHDTNLAAVLGALNLFNMLAPPYCAHLIFELHEMPSGEPALRMLYFNSSRPEDSVDPPTVLVLEGCEEFCPLPFFINFTADIVPEDWEAECQMDKSFIDKVREKQVTIGWFFVIIAAVIVLMSVYVTWRIYSRRQDKYAYHLMPMN